VNSSSLLSLICPLAIGANVHVTFSCSGVLPSCRNLCEGALIISTSVVTLGQDCMQSLLRLLICLDECCRGSIVSLLDLSCFVKIPNLVDQLNLLQILKDSSRTSRSFI